MGDPLARSFWHQSEVHCVINSPKMGSRGNWQWATDISLKNGTGRVRIGEIKSRIYSYILKDGEYSKIVNGEFKITGHGINNEIIVADNDTDFCIGYAQVIFGEFPLMMQHSMDHV